ncbi:MAG TPA: hypothetical protein EYO84_06170, partial [Planctomycetes bacterium]|nr:hypothetical protein [Planctomycetota bacterium]
MTYPDPDFNGAIDELVAPLRVNVADRHEDFRDATVMTRISFSPRFRFFSSDQKRLLREWTGWMPTAELIAEMHVARAIDLHDRKDPLAAVEEYGERYLLRDHPDLRSTILKAPHHVSNGRADDIAGFDIELELVGLGLHCRTNDA